MQTTRTENNFSFDKRVWYFIAFLFAFLSILRGIRFPNTYSYSQVLFNYDFGFVKRGLIGEILSQFDNLYLQSYYFFVVLSFTIFFINVFLISKILKDLIDSGRPFLIGAAITFSSSLAVVFLSHTVGYLDHFGLLITLITLKIRSYYRKLFFLVMIMPFALLVHETILVVFFPIIIMSLIFSINQKECKKQVLLLIIFSAFLLLGAIILNNATLDKASVHQMYIGLQSVVDQPLIEFDFSVLYRNSEDNLNMMKYFWSSIDKVVWLASSLLVTAPLFLFFIYFSIKLLKESKHKYHLIVLSVFASLSPLLLHFWGWDMHRWNTLTITTSFLMLVIAHKSMNNNYSFKTPHSIYAIAVFLVFLSGISSLPLFDGNNMKDFPFVEHQKYIYGIFNGNEEFPSVSPR